MEYKGYEIKRVDDRQPGMTPDLSYPGGVTGTQYYPDEEPFEDWFREYFANSGRLVAMAVVRAGARHYSLSSLPATGIAYVAREMDGSVIAEIYPFHEASEANDDAHNFFWTFLSEDDDPPWFEHCPLEVLQVLSPATNVQAYMWRRRCALDYPPHVFPQLHQQLQLVLPQEGSRWRLLREVKRVDLGLFASRGLTGVIEESSEERLSLKMDKPIVAGRGTGASECSIEWLGEPPDRDALWKFLQDCEPATS